MSFYDTWAPRTKKKRGGAKLTYSPNIQRTFESRLSDKIEPSDTTFTKREYTTLDTTPSPSISPAVPPSRRSNLSPVTTPPQITAYTEGLERDKSGQPGMLLTPGRTRRESRSRRHQLLVTVENPEKGSNGVRYYTINVGTDLPKYTSLMKGEETWNVRRRYNHFRALFENICTQRDLGVALPLAQNLLL